MGSFNWPPEGGETVDSINGLTGAVELIAGANVTITESGNNITIAATGGGGGGGIDAIGTIDSQPPSLDGAAITGSDLVLQSASATDPGLVNLTTQTFAGAKTFSSAPILSSLTASLPLQLDSSKNIVSAAIDLSGAEATGILAPGRFPILTGDITTAGGALATTLATVNSNVGSFSPAAVTVNGKGLVTAASNVTTGNLTEATSAVLTITGGTGSLLGSGASIQVKQASTSQSGYLSSTDWNTFNGKQAAGNYITALTGDGAASGPGSAALTLASVNSNTGAFGSATQVATFTVNAKGLMTAAGNTSIQIAESQVTNLTSDLAAKMTNPMTTAGDMIYGGASGAPTRLTAGTSGQIPISAGTSVAFGTLPGNSTALAAPSPTYLTATGTQTGLFFNITAPISNIGAGATYINNGNTYTVVSAVTTAQSGWILFTTGTGITTSNTLTKSSGTGPTSITFSAIQILASYTTPSGPAPLYLEVEMVGAGGGGGGSGQSSGGAGAAGGNTVFALNAANFLFCNAGAGGAATGGVGGAGGTASSLGYTIASFTGANGSEGQAVTSINTVISSGAGGNSIYGGGGGAVYAAAPGSPGATNSGGGGAGGGAANSATGLNTGPGGGAGAGARAIIPNPGGGTTFLYAIGTGGSAGSAGTGGQQGGNGAVGRINIIARYQ